MYLISNRNQELEIFDFSLISKGTKSLYSLRGIFIYANVSLFVLRSSLFIFSWAKLLCKNSILRIIFPSYIHITMLVYDRRYFEAAIASIFIFFKVFSNYQKLTTNPTFSAYCFVNGTL